MRQGFHWNGSMISGCLILGVILACGTMAPVLSFHDPIQIDLAKRLHPPDSRFPLGTDHLGRCTFSRMIYGARISLGTSLAATIFSLIPGMITGILGGLSGRFLNALFRGGIDMALSFPGFLLALIVIGIMGQSLLGLVMAIAMANMAWWTRFIRDLVSEAAAREFVLAGRVVGVRGWRLFRQYLFPQIWPSVLIAASLRSGWSIMAVSGLSYLGLGFQPPTPEWGTMLQESRLYLGKAPWLMLSPGAAVTLTVLGFNLLVEGLRDAFQIREAGVY